MSISDLREDAYQSIRSLQRQGADEVVHGEQGETRVLECLLDLYSHVSRDPNEVTRASGKKAQDIDGWELVYLMDKNRINKNHLKSLCPSRTFARMLSVQKLTPTKLRDLYTALQERAKTPFDIRQLARVSFKSKRLLSHSQPRAVLQRANAVVNEFVASLRQSLGPVDTPDMDPSALTITLFREADVVSLHHCQLRALEADLGVEEDGCDVMQAREWISDESPELLTERIWESQNVATGGFRFSPFDSRTVAQAYCTAQCIVSLLQTGNFKHRSQQLKRAFGFIESQREPFTGRIKGWGYFPKYFQNPTTDILAWVIIAEANAIRHQLWSPGDEYKQAAQRLNDHLRELVKGQHVEGGYSPSYRVGKRPDTDNRMYTTALAVWSFLECLLCGSISAMTRPSVVKALNSAINWIMTHHDRDKGFHPDPSANKKADFFAGLHAQVLFVLALAEKTRVRYSEITAPSHWDQFKQAEKMLLKWLTNMRPSVDAHNLTLDLFQYSRTGELLCENSRYLWAPWSLAALKLLNELFDDTELEHAQNQVVIELFKFWCRQGKENWGAAGTYEIAEALYGISIFNGGDRG